MACWEDYLLLVTALASRSTDVEKELGNGFITYVYGEEIFCGWVSVYSREATANFAHIHVRNEALVEVQHLSWPKMLGPLFDRGYIERSCICSNEMLSLLSRTSVVGRFIQGYWETGRPWPVVWPTELTRKSRALCGVDVDEPLTPYASAASRCMTSMVV